MPHCAAAHCRASPPHPRLSGASTPTAAAAIPSMKYLPRPRSEHRNHGHKRGDCDRRHRRIAQPAPPHTATPVLIFGGAAPRRRVIKKMHSNREWNMTYVQGDRDRRVIETKQSNRDWSMTYLQCECSHSHTHADSSVFSTSVVCLFSITPLPRRLHLRRRHIRREISSDAHHTVAAQLEFGSKV